MNQSLEKILYLTSQNIDKKVLKDIEIGFHLKQITNMSLK